MINFWSYSNELKKIRSDLTKIFNNTLQKGVIFFGDNLNNFEKNFINKYNAKYGIAVGSGTDALLISLMAIGIRRGDEVITAANTAIPTISAIKNSGANPILVDINDDYLKNFDDLKKKLPKKLKR